MSVKILNYLLRFKIITFYLFQRMNDYTLIQKYFNNILISIHTPTSEDSFQSIKFMAYKKVLKITSGSC